MSFSLSCSSLSDRLRDFGGEVGILVAVVVGVGELEFDTLLLAGEFFVFSFSIIVDFPIGLYGENGVCLDAGHILQDWMFSSVGGDTDIETDFVDTRLHDLLSC